MVVGSANFSERAFSGKQAETLLAFDDDPAAWAHFSREYERVKAGATSELALPNLEVAEVPLEDVPVLQEAQGRSGGVTLYLGGSAEAATLSVTVGRVERLANGYNTFLKPLVKPKGDQVSVTREVATKAVRLLKGQQTHKEVQAPTWLSISLEAGTVVLSGKEVSLEVDEAALREDVRLLVAYFENFGGFFGDVERLQRDYFMFMSWLFAAPFVCDLRNRALGHGGYVFDYPLFAVLFGKSNCGKTRLIETLLRAMFGHARFLNKDDFTRTNLRGLLLNSRRFPAVFDDVKKKRFDLHAGDVIKDELFMLPEYPAFVLSMNADNHAFSTEIRKRCLMVYTNASLPDHTEAAKRLYGGVREVQARLGTARTALYRSYLRRALTSFGEALPEDLLGFSSGLLVELFGEHAGGPLPAWCAPVTTAAYGERKYENVKAELAALYRTNPGRWTVGPETVVLSVESFEAHGLRKEIPDWLLKEGSKGGNIVLHRAQLEAFMGFKLTRRWPFRR